MGEINGGLADKYIIFLTALHFEIHKYIGSDPPIRSPHPLITPRYQEKQILNMDEGGNSFPSLSIIREVDSSLEKKKKIIGEVKAGALRMCAERTVIILRSRTRFKIEGSDIFTHCKEV
ncbi:hypothetical protein CDAR_313621 [Caerostris darwini]|uniref:Uncharacterized protein n=1 Tax=Caerostris darwini TaxID=1538125 RepID=A0AAV4N1D6_9ARAC|nr:hypothetical protein CDAR_313621 [Caerostris darwini]